MDTKQNWKGMDGSIAWHLIDRQAENWNQVGKMMNDWFIENIPTKEWVGLTDEDDIDWEEGGTLRDLVKAIEAKLKERNT